MNTTTNAKAQHTPGPWTAIAPPASCLTTRFIEAEDGTHVAKIGHMDFSNGVYVDVANARLIAAAPEMLDALRFVSEFYQLHFDVMPVAFQTFADIVDTAIAKAEGRDWATPRPTR